MCENWCDRRESPTLIKCVRYALATMTAVGAVVGFVGCGGDGGGAEDESRPTAAQAAVYIQTNSAPSNFVRVYFRSSNGRLRPGPTVATGGAGRPRNPPLCLPILDSQESVRLSLDGRLLFVVNAGSNTVSSFRVAGRRGLELADEEPSRGALPVSLAVARLSEGRTLLYVLNERGESVSGYMVSAVGELTPISGGVRKVSGGLSATVGFDRSGRMLTVLNRADETISTFSVDPGSGRLGEERITKATGTGDPFGLAYTSKNLLVVANAGSLPTLCGTPSAPPTPPPSRPPAPGTSTNAADAGPAGSGSTYRISPETAAVTAVDTERAGASGTCWVAITQDDRHAFMTSALTKNISRFDLAADGALVLRGTTPTPGAALDEDMSRDGRYLYVLNADLNSGMTGFGKGRITAFRIATGGNLVRIASTPVPGFGGASGLAAW